MKKAAGWLLALLAAVSLSACGGEEAVPEEKEVLAAEEALSAPQEEPETSGEAEIPSRSLVVYFSQAGSSAEGVDALASASPAVGNTQQAAQMVQEQTGADIFQIVTVQPYPAEYEEITQAAKQEQEQEARPALSARVENLEDYDTVYLGYPLWWGTMPMPVYTFLEENDLSGKTILPFCTHGGSGLGSSVEDLAAFCPEADVQPGLAIKGSDMAGIQQSIEEWLAGQKD